MHRYLLVGSPCILVCTSLAATEPWVTEMLTGFSLTIQLTWRDVIAHAVDLVISPPQLTGYRMEVLAD